MTYNVKIRKQGNWITVVEAGANPAAEAMDWVENNLKTFVPEARHEGAPGVKFDGMTGSMIVSRWHGYEFQAKAVIG